MSDPMTPRLIEVEADATTAPLGHYGAVSTAFESIHAELYNFLRRSTRDEGAAEDLLQEAFLRLTKEVDAGRTPEHVRGWLYRVASNFAISRGRRRTTAFEWISRYGRQSVGDDVDSPEAGVLARERTSAIDTVLAGTSPRRHGRLCCCRLTASAGRRSLRRSVAAMARPRPCLSRTRVRVRLELEQQGDVR